MTTPDDMILSVQLYTLRNLGGTDAVLDGAKAAGFRHVELIGSHLDAAEETAALLHQRGLKAPSSHVSLAALRTRPEAVVHACQVLGVRDLFVPAVPPEERMAGATYWDGLGAELGTLARQFAGQGIGLGYHNHDWELAAKEDGVSALDHLFGAAGDAPLTWQVDVAWLARGGADVAAVMQRHGARIVAAHVKDMAPLGTAEAEDGWTDVGHGTLDWPALWADCQSAGARLMVVEHDNPAAPAASVRRSFDYVTGTLGARA